MNEDTNGEAAALRKEIKRLREELARTKEGQHQQAPGADHQPWGEGFGSPLRFPVLRTISSSPLHSSPGGPDQQVCQMACSLKPCRLPDSLVRWVNWEERRTDDVDVGHTF